MKKLYFIMTWTTVFCLSGFLFVFSSSSNCKLRSQELYEIRMHYSENRNNKSVIDVDINKIKKISADHQEDLDKAHKSKNQQDCEQLIAELEAVTRVIENLEILIKSRA